MLNWKKREGVLQYRSLRCDDKWKKEEDRKWKSVSTNSSSEQQEWKYEEMGEEGEYVKRVK